MMQPGIISEIPLETDDCDSLDSSDVYPHQVGGHHVLIKHPTHPELIVKPYIAKEIQFYEDAKHHPELQPVISKYYGSIRLNLHGEDLTFGMQEPCVLDMKIGRRLYDDDASPDKAARMKKKSAGSTSGDVGFRISGIKYPDAKTGSIVVKFKRDVRTLKLDELFPSMMNFFALLSREEALDLTDNYLQKLEIIQTVVLGSNALFYSSSILFVYDHHDFQKWDCRMIDFVHSKIYPNDVDVLDDNYLEGLRNLTDYFRQIRNKLSESNSS